MSNQSSLDGPGCALRTRPPWYRKSQVAVIAGAARITTSFPQIEGQFFAKILFLGCAHRTDPYVPTKRVTAYRLR